MAKKRKEVQRTPLTTEGRDQLRSKIAADARASAGIQTAPKPQQTLGQQVGERPGDRARFSATIGGQTFSTSATDLRSGRFEQEQGSALRRLMGQAPAAEDRREPSPYATERFAFSQRVDTKKVRKWLDSQSPEEQMRRYGKVGEPQAKQLAQGNQSALSSLLTKLGLSTGGDPKESMEAAELAIKVAKLQGASKVEMLRLQMEKEELAEEIAAREAQNTLDQRSAAFDETKEESRITEAGADRELTVSEGEAERTSAEGIAAAKNKSAQQIAAGKSQSAEDIAAGKIGDEPSYAEGIRIDRILVRIQRVEELIDKADADDSRKARKEAERLRALLPDLETKLDLALGGKPPAGGEVADETPVEESPVADATPPPVGDMPPFPGDENAVAGTVYIFPNGKVLRYIGNGEAVPV